MDSIPLAGLGGADSQSSRSDTVLQSVDTAHDFLNCQCHDL